MSMTLSQCDGHVTRLILCSSDMKLTESPCLQNFSSFCLAVKTLFKCALGKVPWDFLLHAALERAMSWQGECAWGSRYQGSSLVSSLDYSGHTQSHSD